MVKVGISIGLDSGEAESNRSHVDRAGMGVSFYFVNAAILRMIEFESTEAQFARIDALIADVEERAERDVFPDEADGLPLSADEIREVDEAIRLVHGGEEPRARNRDEVV